MNTEKMKSLLQSKCLILENIGECLHEEEGLLKAGNARAITAKCVEVDSLLKKLENINGRIESLESSDNEFSSNTPDEDLKHLLIRIIRQAEFNRLLMDSLVDRALKSRDNIKKELDCTVAGSRISGYRPFSGKRPIYLDRRN